MTGSLVVRDLRAAWERGYADIRQRVEAALAKHLSAPVATSLPTGWRQLAPGVRFRIVRIDGDVAEGELEVGGNGQ